MTPVGQYSHTRPASIIAMRIVGSLGVLGHFLQTAMTRQDVFGSKMLSAWASPVVISYVYTVYSITHWPSFQHTDNKKGRKFLRKPTSSASVQCIEAVKLLNAAVLSKALMHLWFPGRWQGWCVKWCYLQHGSGVSIHKPAPTGHSHLSSTRFHPAKRIKSRYHWCPTCLISRKLKSDQR